MPSKQQVRNPQNCSLFHSILDATEKVQSCVTENFAKHNYEAQACVAFKCSTHTHTYTHTINAAHTRAHAQTHARTLFHLHLLTCPLNAHT